MEPLASIDNPRKGELLSLLRKLKFELETAFLYVTHDDREVKSFGTHVAILHDGVIIQAGAVADVIANPKNEVVKDMLRIGRA